MEEKQKNQNKSFSDADFYADTMEMEKKKKASEDFNCQKSVYENSYSKGLNNNGGVFNSSAIFKTAPEKQ